MRNCIFLLLVAGVMLLFGCHGKTVVLSASSALSQIKIEVDKDSARLVKLGWDTESTGRDSINLLRNPAALQLMKDGKVLNPDIHLKFASDTTVEYRFTLAGKSLFWKIGIGSDISFQFTGDINTEVDKLIFVLPLNPRKTVTSVISSNWLEDQKFHLPIVLSAPDIGQMLVTGSDNRRTIGFTEGNRKEALLQMSVEIPVPNNNNISYLTFTPLILPAPNGYSDLDKWKLVRRGWFNFLQQSCGASGGGKEVVGVWSNNALSDPVSNTIYMLADAVLLMPEIAPDVSIAKILKKSVEYFIDNKTTDYGLVGYTAGGIPATIDDKGDPDPLDKEYNPGHHQTVMDANPSLIIGAWAYVKTSSDTAWLNKRLKDLALIADYMEQRDIDNDGLIESRQSGNSDTRPPRNPDMAFDAYSSGHKNAYVNILSYRAYKCMADLYKTLGNATMEKKYQMLSVNLKAAFLKTFYNQETGWLGWWKSRDGELHDIHSDIPTSLAVSYGLIDVQSGKEMLTRYWDELRKTEFNRFDLGVPICIKPVQKKDMEHYTDFKMFLNGGCAVSNASYTIDALNMVGMSAQADTILNAMINRQATGVYPNGGAFQNGFVDNYPLGAEVYDWDGNTAGYEGHLVYCWTFIHSLIFKETTFQRLRTGF